ncbi:M50 family metallopeptidase [Rhodobacteraceae bacterium N5(2021)]|uniref:M50 family metallopeptidase n=1 Tax=Gymnodinialimonas phycosphaerae TaxID=2841589 RepID=A0A975TV60_9RHOB|nr:M50 family metallopeptidase [Gymnodinialimonas phycosphaerae]MBY4891474.1 M50 family metallopeptidase [Gymnodinialimonas phycosphaerae]
MAFLRGHWQLIALTVVVFALWSTPVVLPLKLLVVFFHELSHGLAAVLTGGAIESISVNFQQGGEAWTRGGSRFVILTAGYLGSLAIGAGLLFTALRGWADRAVLMGLGVLMLVVLVLYVRDIPAALICGATGAALLAASRFLSAPICDLILRVIGLSSLIYVPYDIFDDTLRRASLNSDARMLAEEIGGTTMMWGALWLVISLAVIFWCLRRGLGRDSNVKFAR